MTLYMTNDIERKNLNDDTDAIKAHQSRDGLETDVGGVSS